MPDVLGGIRVVDVTSGPVGGIATMVLADFGADVVKVEPPGGDRFRSAPAAPLWLRGKRSVTADLRTAEGLALLHDLGASADVLVVGGPPARARRWGIDADAAIARAPGLVHCSITGWGPAGPLAEVPAYEGVVAARAGRMLGYERQLRRGGPVFAAVGVAGHAAAQGAVQGILAALVARSRGGGAQRVETSLLQALLPYDLAELLLVEIAERGGAQLASPGAVGGDLPTLNYHPLRAKDGRWIQCGNLLEHLLIAFFEATGLLGDLLADGRFSSPPGSWSPEAVEAARDMMLTRLQERTAEEWMDIFRANGNVAAEPFFTTAEALHHPDLVAGGDIVVYEDPVLGEVRTIGPIAELTGTPARVEHLAPAAGQHTEEVVAELRSGGRPPFQAAPAPAVGPPPGRPLDGIVIVDFATIIAAPLATTFLNDLGARTVKVEQIDGDPYRHLVASGALAAKTTAGKTSICVDLKTPEGRGIAQDLVRTADVVLHNTRPGVAERLGLGEEELRAQNPRLVWVSVTGYSRRSPSAHRPATHPCAGAATGGATYQAGSATEAPCGSLAELRETSRQLSRANSICPDPNTSVVVASAILMALVARERFGVGQAVYVNMLAANMYANSDDAVAYEGKAPRPKSDDQLLGPSAGYRLYPAGEGWVFVALTTDDEWRRGLAALGRPELARDARFATAEARRVHDEELATEIAKELKARTAAEWEGRFTAAGVGGVVADGATPGRFFAHDPQVLANDFSPECAHRRFGTHRRWGPLARVNGSGVYGAGALAGEHTDEILAALGRSPEQIAALRAARVVASEAVDIAAG